jgi:phage terminase large subunit-like protein
MAARLANPTGDRPVGKYERLAIERHDRDLALSRKPGGHPRGLWFDPAAGERPVQFIERYCRHWKGEWAGQLIKLEEWQKWWIRALFGWKRADGTRRFRKAWVEINRKNAKTTIAGALGLYMLVADMEPGAECYSTATSKDQSAILLMDAIEMAKASPELAKLVKHMRSGSVGGKGGTLYCERLRSRMTSLSSESRTKDGLSPHFDGRDEVHEWNDPDLAAKLDTAMGARRQPLTLEITTAGVYDPTSLGWQHHEYATNVLDGLFEDDRLFVYIAAVDEEDDPLNDPSCWPKANPNLGVSCKRDFLTEQVQEAKNKPSEANKVLRLHFGRWTSSVTRWLDLEKWRTCDISGPEALAQRAAREAALRGRKCFGGLDLSSKLDLTAFALVFPGDGGALDILARFWLPEETIDRELKKKGRRHYREWVDQGWITATPGSVIDLAFIRREVNELSKIYQVEEIGFDPHGAVQMGVELGEDGLTMVEVRQGPPSLSEPCKTFEAAIIARRVRHMGNPVLTWCVGNAVARSDANGNLAPDKKRAKDKIDGVSAIVTALNRVIVAAPKPPTGSYLETQDLVVF